MSTEFGWKETVLLWQDSFCIIKYFLKKHPINLIVVYVSTCIQKWCRIHPLFLTLVDRSRTCFRVFIKTLKQLAYDSSYYKFVHTLVNIQSAWMSVCHWNIFHLMTSGNGVGKTFTFFYPNRRQRQGHNF